MPSPDLTPTPAPSARRTAAEPPAPDLDAWFAIPLERWYREAAEANPTTIPHPGPDGERFLCDVPEHRADGYARVEMLGSGTAGVAPGTLLFHCERLTLRPGDLLYEERKAGLTRRTVG